MKQYKIIPLILTFLTAGNVSAADLDTLKVVDVEEVLVIAAPKENRKLRDRMLELERVLAEYQRREETRKERMENRLRALEGTVAALQQQIVQMVQIQRQPKRRGWW